MVYLAVDGLLRDDGCLLCIVDCLLFDSNPLFRWHIAIHVGSRDWR